MNQIHPVAPVNVDGIHRPTRTQEGSKSSSRNVTIRITTDEVQGASSGRVGPGDSRAWRPGPPQIVQTVHPRTTMIALGRHDTRSPWGRDGEAFATWRTPSRTSPQRAPAAARCARQQCRRRGRLRRFARSSVDEGRSVRARDTGDRVAPEDPSHRAAARRRRAPRSPRRAAGLAEVDTVGEKKIESSGRGRPLVIVTHAQAREEGMSGHMIERSASRRFGVLAERAMLWCTTANDELYASLALRTSPRR